MGRPDSECRGQSLEKTGGRQKGALHPLSLMLGHYPCSLYSVKLGIFMCKKRYLLKNPHCLNGTGWLFPTGRMSHWAQLDFHLVGVLGLSSAWQWRQLWDNGTNTPPRHGCSTVPSEEGTISGDLVRAAVGLGMNPTHLTGAFDFPGHVLQLSARAGGCPVSPAQSVGEVQRDFLRSLRGFRCTSCLAVPLCAPKPLR